MKEVRASKLNKSVPHAVAWFLVVAAMASLITGCATLSMQEWRQMQSSVADTQRRVISMERQSKETAEKLTGGGEGGSSLAQMDARMDELLTEVRRLQGDTEQLSDKLSDLANDVATLRYRSSAVPEPSAPPVTPHPPVAPSLRQPEAPVLVPTPGVAQPPAAPAVPALPPTADPDKEYNKAKDDYYAKKTELALTEFQQFLATFPDLPTSDNAQFYIAVCYYNLKQYDKALEALDRLYKMYPTSNKTSEAMLKEAQIHLDMSQKDKAIEVLKKVLEKFPLSTDAEAAKKKLQDLGVR